MILILIYTLSIRKPLEASIKSTFEASAKKNGILIEALNGLETIKTMGSSGHVQYTWEEATGEIANKSIKTKILSASVINITQFLIQINTIAIVVAGVYLIKDMHLTMGGLIAATILGGRAIAPMASVAGLLSNYEQTKTAFDGLQKIMDMPTERHEGKKFVRRNTFNGNIEFFKMHIEQIVTQYPFLFAVALFVMSVLLFSQAATVRTLYPLGIALGIHPMALIAMFPAVNGYFFIPNYPTVVAAINFDRTGTTRIGKYVLNHSFQIPGFVATIVAIAVGYLIIMFM